MAEYHPVERSVARVLERYPGLKEKIKTLYQKGNYMVLADSDFEFELHSEAKLYTATDWLDVDDEFQEFFFGYYDASPLNQKSGDAIYHVIENEGEASIYHLKNNYQKKIAVTNAWNYQQGCRLQWHPTRQDWILFNDYEEGVITKMVNVRTNDVNRYPHPVQAVCPSGEQYISINYDRIKHNRPDYGYDITGANCLPSPEDDGLWRVSIEDGSTEQIITISELIHNSVPQENHYINHVLYNPGGEKFVFLHRWKGQQGRTSRLYISDHLSEPLLDWETISHYCWLDTDKLLLWGVSKEWGSGYFIIDTETQKATPYNVFEHAGDGHPSASPDGRWIVVDTYPNRLRQRQLLLYDIKKEQSVNLGRFFSPFRYHNTHRCDLHPRWNPDGKTISIDSTHEGSRKSYIIDVSDIIEGKATEPL